MKILEFWNGFAPCNWATLPYWLTSECLFLLTLASRQILFCKKQIKYSSASHVFSVLPLSMLFVFSLLFLRLVCTILFLPQWRPSLRWEDNTLSKLVILKTRYFFLHLGASFCQESEQLWNGWGRCLWNRTSLNSSS
jgi:hypothetical protein